MLTAFLFTACATPSPLMVNFEGHFRELKLPEKAKVKQSAIRRHYDNTYTQVLDAALEILTQHSNTIRTYREAGVIFFLETDGVLIEGRFREWAFPTVVLLDQELSGTEVYAYPLIDLLGEGISEERLKVIRVAFEQKCSEFLERLSVQLTFRSRWPWLLTPRLERPVELGVIKGYPEND
jgi:hypothetical protein